jgi:hypothetical protein
VQFRARLWLFVSFLIAAGAVGGSVAVLIATTSAAQPKDLMMVGVGSVLQCGFILLASILLWAFRSGESDAGYGYIS